MAKIDLSKYGITGTTEIVHNPSYEQLFVEETKPQPLPEEQENGNGVVIPQKVPAKKFQFKKKKGGKA